VSDPIVFDEWALDVTCPSALAFVPLVGGEVYWGMTYIQDRCPGTLTAVVSQDGIDPVNKWVADHPTWLVDYCNPAELLDACTTQEAGQ
jgi:hypothetical protein